MPAIVDGDVVVFDSNAILLYLAEKTGKFLPPKGDKARGELLSWLMFVASGVGPYSGQSVHFRLYAPEKIEYAINRYAFEAQRHFGILDARLAKQKYMLGDTYTIVDMDVWGWARLMPVVLGEGAWPKFPNLKRLVDEISARPAAQRAVALKDKYKFKAEMDDEARNAMFRHLAEKVACSKHAHALARHIAGKQQHAERHHQQRGADLDAAQHQRAIAGARGSDPLCRGLGADGKRGDRRDRDRGAEAHDEGRGDRRPRTSPAPARRPTR